MNDNPIGPHTNGRGRRLPKRAGGLMPGPSRPTKGLPFYWTRVIFFIDVKVPARSS